MQWKNQILIEGQSLKYQEVQGAMSPQVFMQFHPKLEACPMFNANLGTNGPLMILRRPLTIKESFLITHSNVISNQTSPMSSFLRKPKKNKDAICLLHFGKNFKNSLINHQYFMLFGDFKLEDWNLRSHRSMCKLLMKSFLTLFLRCHIQIVIIKINIFFNCLSQRK